MQFFVLAGFTLKIAQNRMDKGLASDFDPCMLVHQNAGKWAYNWQQNGSALTSIVFSRDSIRLNYASISIGT
jgi:hypothetical protein